MCTLNGCPNTLLFITCCSGTSSRCTFQFGLCRGYSLRSNRRLLSGDAFSVLAIRIRRLSIRNIFQNNFYILQFEYPSHWCISSYCVFLKQTTVLFFLTQTSRTYTDFREPCSHHPDGLLFSVLYSLYSVLKVKCSVLFAAQKKERMCHLYCCGTSALLLALSNNFIRLLYY